MLKKSFTNAAIVAIAAGSRIKSTLKTDWGFVDPYETCEDIDNGYADAFGNKCDWYGNDWDSIGLGVEKPCSTYDTDHFKAIEQCCGCYGGRKTGGDDDIDRLSPD